MKQQVIYLDNASTAYPKPPCVLSGIQNYLQNIVVNPSRNYGILSDRANLLVENCRKMLSRIIGCQDYEKISFTHNATHAGNIAIKGFLKRGDHVITTNLEYNAVLRPLHKMKLQEIVEFYILHSDIFGIFNIEKIRSMIKQNTKLLIINHGSNVIDSIAQSRKSVEFVRKATSYLW